MNGRIRVWLLAIAQVALLAPALALLTATPARAWVGTPWRCDSVPKYYCTTVEYDPGSPATNVGRYWEGQTTGATVRWQLWWMQDWQCSSYPSCTWLRNYGAQGWQYNSSFVWFRQGLNPTMTQNALVNMKLQYHEHYYDMSCLCQIDYDWCSAQLDHYLWNATSATIVGSNSC